MPYGTKSLCVGTVEIKFRKLRYDRLKKLDEYEIICEKNPDNRKVLLRSKTKETIFRGVPKAGEILKKEHYTSTFHSFVLELLK